MNFKSLDSLFRDNPKAYSDLLQFIYQEFRQAQSLLILSMKNGDVATFSHLKHKLFSTLNTLEAEELKDSLTEIRHKYDRDDPFDITDYSNKLSHHFDKLLAALQEKKMEITEIKLM